MQAARPATMQATSTAGVGLLMPASPSLPRFAAIRPRENTFERRQDRGGNDVVAPGGEMDAVAGAQGPGAPVRPRTPRRVAAVRPGRQVPQRNEGGAGCRRGLGIDRVEVLGIGGGR